MNLLAAEQKRRPASVKLKNKSYSHASLSRQRPVISIIQRACLVGKGRPGKLSAKFRPCRAGRAKASIIVHAQVNPELFF